ncbi:MAG TPA: hypothetical protein VF791_06635 [Pyrinomonadaceae bacterium]
MPRIARPIFSALLLVFVCLAAGSQARVGAEVYRDRAAFNANAQNLRTIDFEDQSPTSSYPFPGPVIDGVVFESLFGASYVAASMNSGSKVFVANGVGEITQLRAFLPPGTTAVACDQFTRSMLIRISSGESVMISASDSSSFVGFTSDAPITDITFLVDFPEPTEAIVIDNLIFGQRRAGNEPPAPLLLTTSNTGRAVALDSVTKTSEPFNVVSTLNFSADQRTRLTLFLVGVKLTAQDLPNVVVRAEDSQHRIFNLPVEGASMVQNIGWMAQVTVRLTDDLSGAGDVALSVSLNGATSNKAKVNIKPPAN